MDLERRQLIRSLAVGGVAIAGCTGTGDAGGGAAPTTESASAGGTTAEGRGDSGGDGQVGGGVDGRGGGDAATVVELASASFDPVRATVPTGGTVEWVNRDAVDHDVTAAQFHDTAADWDLGVGLSSGGRASHTFEEAGVYEYACTVHGRSSMCGAVLVGGASLEASLPCEAGGTEDEAGDDYDYEYDYDY